MAITINAKGTSANSFTIGKQGTPLHQGPVIDPTTVPEGAFWFDSSLGALRYKGTDLENWRNLVFDDITFLNDTILSTSYDSSVALTNDLTLTPGDGGDVLIDGSRVLAAGSFTESYNISPVVDADVTNISYMDSDADILSLKPATYTNIASGESGTGFLSSEVNAGVGVTTGEFTGVDLVKLSSHLVITAKLQHEQLEAQATLIADLTARIEALEAP